MIFAEMSHPARIVETKERGICDGRAGFFYKLMTGVFFRGQIPVERMFAFLQNVSLLPGIHCGLSHLALPLPVINDRKIKISTAYCWKAPIARKTPEY